MPKTNFTKVEEALVEGLRKITVNHLLELADLAAAVDARPKEPQTPDNLISKEDKQLKQARLHLINSLNKDLKDLKKHDTELYSKVQFKRKDLKKFLEHPDSLSPEEWDKIKKVKEQVESFKQELVKGLPVSTDEDLVEKERKKHVNKRFNTNEKWLPLH